MPFDSFLPTTGSSPTSPRNHFLPPSLITNQARINPAPQALLSRIWHKPSEIEPRTSVPQNYQSCKSAPHSVSSCGVLPSHRVVCMGDADAKPFVNPCTLSESLPISPETPLLSVLLPKRYPTRMNLHSDPDPSHRFTKLLIHAVSLWIVMTANDT